MWRLTSLNNQLKALELHCFPEVLDHLALFVRRNYATRRVAVPSLECIGLDEDGRHTTAKAVFNVQCDNPASLAVLGRETTSKLNLKAAITTHALFV
jgi:hypothetical protein